MAASDEFIAETFSEPFGPAAMLDCPPFSISTKTEWNYNSSHNGIIMDMLVFRAGFDFIIASCLANTILLFASPSSAQTQRFLARHLTFRELILFDQNFIVAA